MSEEKKFFGGGQSTSYFSGRKKQLNRSESAVEPMGIPMVKEMIQNADDRKAEALFLVFTEESLWITNDGETFNYNETQDDDGNRVAGDLANLLGVAQSLAESEEDRVGRHGTGFELIYCVANRFEIHWWDRTHGNRVSMRSNPELLESGASETWDYPWDHSDFDALDCPFDIEERQEDRRGVLFKADWRTHRGAEQEFGEHGPIFKNAAFPQWNPIGRRAFFDSCKAYAPFMIQFCKSITDLTVIWLQKGKSEFFKTTRRHAYPTSKYAGKDAGEFGYEEVQIYFKSGKCDKSALRDFSGLKEEIQKLWRLKIGPGNLSRPNELKNTKAPDSEIRLLHGWAAVHGTSGVGNNMEMDREKVLASWKFPEFGQFHTHNEFDCPYCPMRNQDGWIPDRTSVVHIHFPLDSIDEELGRLEKPGQTLLHSILPLGVVSPNRFMVSADLYVNEGRAQLEFQGDKGVWNSCSALTAFWLHSEMLSWLVDSTWSKSEAAIIQALPADPENWFSSLNLSNDGFPDGVDLLGGGARSKLYFDLQLKEWLLGTNNELCMPAHILIPTNEEDEYDDNIRLVLESLVPHHLSVMRRETYDHILTTGSYVLDNLRNLLRKSRVYDPGLSPTIPHQILAEVETAALNDLSIECKIALARLAVHLDSNFSGAVYPDENGKLRTKAEFSTIPEGLSVLQELQGERPSLHPDIGDIIEPGVTTVQDALGIIQGMQESEPDRFENLDDDAGLLNILTRMADQILSDPGITDQDKILYEFIPCRLGGRSFLRAYQHLVECSHSECGSKNPPLMGPESICVECGGILLRGDLGQRIVLPTGRREDWSRMHIMSPDEQDIPAEVSERIVTACSAMHFPDKLADAESKVGLMRYLGKKGGNAVNFAKQVSLFHEGALHEWLDLGGDSEAVSRCRKIFLEELKDYAKTGGRTNLRGLFNDSPIFYDHDHNWAPASEFILYVDEVTLEMLQRGKTVVRTPHLELLDENQDENDWMTLSELGSAKKNVEFEHLEAAIRGLLGEVLDSYGVETDDKCRSLASIAAHLLRHEKLLEDKSEGFDNLAWVPIGHQDGFDNESDLLCRWSEFPLPGPEFDSIWGRDRYNPHITYDEGEKPVSPHDYFNDSDLEWIRAKVTEDGSWASSVGMGTKPSAERMFLALLSGVSPNSAPVLEGLYQLLSELEEVPERYRNSVHRFFHPMDGAWHEGIGEDSLLVDSPLEGELIGGSCISREGLSAAAQTVLEMLLRCGTTRTGTGSSEAISRISQRWSELPRRQLRDAVPLLKRLWRSFHDVEGDAAAVDCWTSDGGSVLFPMGDDVRAVDSIVICPRASALHHFKGRGGVFTIDELAQKDDEELELHRSHLAHALSSNGALVWDVITEGEVTLESRARITRLRDELGLEGEVANQEDAYAWASAMVELEGWYLEGESRTAVPFPHWRRAELVVDLADADNVYFVPVGSVHGDMVADFRMMGLGMLHIRQEDEESITDIPGRTAEDGPFPGFDEGITSENVDIGPGDRDGFAPLSDYLGDLLTAIEHRFEGRPMEGTNPLLFLSQLINGYRTPKRLQLRWTVGGVDVTKGERYWTAEISFSDPPVWPQVDVTYRTVTPERYRETIIRNVLEKGLRKRLDRDSEDAEGERTRLANALGRQEPVFSADILAIIGPLLRYANPRRWEEVSGFEGVWEGREPRLSSDLILNPDVQAAKEKILHWYNDMGCQICGQLTPDGPGSRSHEESRVQIFKRKATKYRWESATEQGGDVGNWLYLCPTHHRLHSKRCVELHVLVGDEEVELADLVDRARRDRGVLSAISEDRIYYNIYERRGESDGSPWEEDDGGQADWTGIKQVQRIEGNHVRKIVAKIRDYVNHRLG